MPKHEQRKQARAARQAEWDAFLATKPDGDYVNPEDAAAIERAQKQMGDFKLKSDQDYVPPQGERMTAARKKQQVRSTESAPLPRNHSTGSSSTHGTFHTFCHACMPRHPRFGAMRCRLRCWRRGFTR